MQPSLFGVEASEPTPADLAGLLAGPGELHRMGGTARVSVTVDAGWRVHVLVAELAGRSLPASWQPVGDESGRFEVCTAYTTRLVPLAGRWGGGPPARLHLNGPALRLWVAAAGAPELVDPDSAGQGYLLRLRPADQPGWPAIGAALVAAGLAGEVVDPAPASRRPAGGTLDGPAYRITGHRQLARLAELVGDPPTAAPPDTWPAPATS